MAGFEMRDARKSGIEECWRKNNLPRHSWERKDLEMGEG